MGLQFLRAETGVEEALPQGLSQSRSAPEQSPLKTQLQLLKKIHYKARYGANALDQLNESTALLNPSAERFITSSSTQKAILMYPGWPKPEPGTVKISSF